MNELIEYLNSLPVEQRDPFAERCGTTVGYIRKACSVGSLFNPELCVAIEIETNKKISRQKLRPDDWMRIWPEIVEAA
jgi:hypothetical protein